MEKAFAYICTAADTAPRLLKRYCRKVYELGYVPICPKLSEVQYLQPDNPDEKRDFHSISHQKLGRCRMLVVCGSEISNSMSAEIGARRKEKHHLHHPRWSCQNQGSRRIKPFLTLPFLADIMKAGKQGKFVMRISL